MDTTNPTAPAIFAWNTGCLYSEHGQRIAATEIDGTIFFVDLDRMIDGQLPAPDPSLPRLDNAERTIRQRVESFYGANKYEMCDGDHREILKKLEAAARAVPTALR